MNILATIEARMGASRLPGKVMLSLQGAPMLHHKIRRVRRSKYIDGVKVLTTVDETDKIILDFCHSIHCSVSAGSVNDVMDRIIDGTKQEKPDIIVQLTADNPLIEPDLIDDCVKFLMENELDYVSNSLSQNVPLGLNVRCFKREALLKAAKICEDPLLRVHGGYFIQTLPKYFKIGENPVSSDYLQKNVRLTVDEPSDFELIRRIYGQLYPKNEDFNFYDVVKLFKRHPELQFINEKVLQKSVGDG